MTEMDSNSFDAWFARAMGGHTPFPYQRAFAQAEHLPELLEVQTGTGKTAAAVLGWLWRRRQEHLRQATPRRLVYCLPMRVLVEQTHACVVRWLNNLGLLAGKATFEGDKLVRYDIDWSEKDKVAVVTLMGGESQDDWREHPEQETVLVGTQDMLLSRALNRGFAMPPQQWPIDFGFLNVDALWVMDEVQLMGVGRTTSVQLQQFWDEAPPPYGRRHTVWMSATLGSKTDSTDLPDWMCSPEREGQSLTSQPHRHTKADLHHRDFIRRWRAPKRLELRLEPTDAAAKPSRGKHKKASRKVGRNIEAGWTIESPDLLESILSEAKDGRLVLVFVNQVTPARQLYERLCKSAGDEPEILLLHGRMRPHDRRRLARKLESAPPAVGCVVVATQVLEAGVDLDAHALFTELCPWPSLVQRLGRLNRSGTRPSAEDFEAGKREPAKALVFEPLPVARKEQDSKGEYDDRYKPYDARSVEYAREVLRTVATEHAGSVSPETLSELPIDLPFEGPVLRRFDLDDLFDTDSDLSGGHTDVTPYLRAADRDVDAYLLWRRIEGGVDPDEQVPIHRDELCPAPFYEAQEAFAEREVWILTLATERERRAAWRKARGYEIHAGDTVMVDIKEGGYRDDAGWTGNPKDVPGVIIDRWGNERAWIRFDGDMISLVHVIDGHITGARARREDPRSFTRKWIGLEHHLLTAEQKASELVEILQLGKSIGEAVIRAARWHDVGKALERNVKGETCLPFQDMLRAAGCAEYGHPRPGALYAKSNGRGGSQSAGFRHEMASLLAFLESRHSDDDLAAFLILAHHGKVRLLPEAWNDENPIDLCGVLDGDTISAGALPDADGPILLDLKRVLPSREHRSWQGRVRQLLDTHGPFLLAYLEGLVRVTDWRASSWQ